MEIEELKKELEKLKDLKIYVFEGEVYVKVEDYREKTIENRKLKEDIAWYEKEEDRLREENRLLKNEIAWMKDHTKYNYLKDELYIDGTMTATKAKFRLQQAEDIQKYISRLEEENKKLNERVEELERLVRELIQWKEDKKIIQIDKNRKESGLAIHNYHIEETKKEDEVYDEDEVDEEYEEDDEIRLLNSIS